MELILTSFGLSHLASRLKENPDHFPAPLTVISRFLTEEEYFRMPPLGPPLRMSTGLYQDLATDCSILLLCDRIILDSKSWEKLTDGKRYRGYEKTSEVMRVLHHEGFVRVEDFDSIVRDNQELLGQMLELDLRRIDDWIQPLRESLQVWHDLIWEGGQGVSGVYDREQYMNRYNLLEEAVTSSKKRVRSEYREAFRRELTDYLAYVNANLVVSHSLGAGFHDWYDYGPFYRQKFLRIGVKKRPIEKKIKAVTRLFELFVPEFDYRNWSPKNILKVLTDKRVADLRRLVDQAVKGEVEFDLEFANRTLREVFAIERRMARVRSIVSWLSLPIGYVPVVGSFLEKGTGEIVERVVESKLKKDHRWFYLISETFIGKWLRRRNVR